MNKYTLGIDIGSTTSKCCIVKDGKEIIATSLIIGGIANSNADVAVREVLEKAKLSIDEIENTVATGYGRNTYSAAQYQVSELTCHALGGKFLYPDVRTIIDIGGQDAKVIEFDNSGRMSNFLMNDKCAAGTGRFLDVMANILGVPLSSFETYAAKSTQAATISSTCTVFAESEVISQLAAKKDLNDVILGICESVAKRVASMVKRINVQDRVCMSGGVAQNGAVRLTIAKEIGHDVYHNEYSQLFGAIGAAIYGYNKIL